MQVCHKLNPAVAAVGDGVDRLIEGVLLERVGGKSEAVHHGRLYRLVEPGEPAGYNFGGRTQGIVAAAWVERILRTMRHLSFVGVLAVLCGALVVGCASKNAKDDKMELIWPKKSYGAEGSVVVGFDGRTARLFDLKD